jgi:acyl carrier protein
MFERVRRALAEQLEMDEEGLTMETDLNEDLGIDSLDVVELITSMEDELGIVVTEESMDELKTIGDVVRFLEKLV